MTIGAVGATGLVLAGILAISLSRGIGQEPLGDVDAGISDAEVFRLPALGSTDRIVDLADYQGGPVLLYFWASYCVPCRTEAPMLERLWPEYRERGYTFIGVNILDAKPDAEKFVRDFELSFPMAFDGDGEAYLQYGVYGIPETFFVERGLRIDDKYLGELTESLLRDRLDQLDVGRSRSGG